jgi:hypothetical protein
MGMLNLIRMETPSYVELIFSTKAVEIPRLLSKILLAPHVLGLILKYIPLHLLFMRENALSMRIVMTGCGAQKPIPAMTAFVK